MTPSYVRLRSRWSIDTQCRARAWIAWQLQSRSLCCPCVDSAWKLHFWVAVKAEPGAKAAALARGMTFLGEHELEELSWGSRLVVAAFVS